MLVDLGRNDLGRVSRVGTVEVTDYMMIHRYSRIMHICSQVEGDIAEQYDAAQQRPVNDLISFHGSRV